MRAVVLLCCACNVGEAPPTSDAPPAGPGLAVSALASPSGGGGRAYTPRNIAAIWVEGPGGFVKTIGRWAGVREQHLVAWNAASGNTDTDAVSGATRQDYAAALTATWNLRDRQGQVVPDGTYTLRMESADDNATTAAQNNQGMFTFVKGAEPMTQSGLSNGGFSAVSITLTP